MLAAGRGLLAADGGLRTVDGGGTSAAGLRQRIAGNSPRPQEDGRGHWGPAGCVC